MTASIRSIYIGDTCVDKNTSTRNASSIGGTCIINYCLLILIHVFEVIIHGV